MVAQRSGEEGKGHDDLSSNTFIYFQLYSQMNKKWELYLKFKRLVMLIKAELIAENVDSIDG